MQAEVKPFNIYRHYKDGTPYVIKSICKHGSKDSSLPNVAIYCKLYEESWLYYRDVADFNEVVTWVNGANLWRYKYIGNLLDVEPDYKDEDIEPVIGYVSIKEGKLKIRDEHLVDFIYDNKDMIVPMHIENQRRRRKE